MRVSSLVLVILTVALAAFFRLYRLDTIPPGLYVDQACDGNDAVAAWRSGDFQVYYPEANGHEGLMIVPQALLFGLTGQSRPWIVRLPSAVLGVFTVLGIYLLARQLGLKSTAWLAALFMAASFWHINASRMGGLWAPPVFFLVWALWLLGNALSATETRRALLWAGLAGLIYGLGFHTYQAYRVTPLLLLFFWQRPAAPRSWCVGAMTVGVAVLTVLPIALFAIREPEVYFHRVQQLQLLGSRHPVRDLIHNLWRTVAMFNFAGDWNSRHNLPGRPMLYWPVGFLFLMGLWVAARRQRWLWAWVAIGLLPAVLAGEGVPHAGRAVLSMPAAFLLAALGAEWVSRYWPKALSLPVVAGLFALGVALEGYRSYFIQWARDPKVAECCDAPLLSSAASLNALPVELPKYVLLDRNPMTVGGLPIGAQVIMFLTDTATPERQRAKNFYYLTIDQTNQIQRGYIYLCRIVESPP